MSDLSNTLENDVIDYYFRPASTPITRPTTVYVRLFTAVTDAEAGTGTVVSGGSYADTAVTFGAPSNGVSTNSLVQFPTATASWGTVTHFAIVDNAGNFLTIIKALSASQAIASGQRAEFAAAALSITIA